MDLEDEAGHALLKPDPESPDEQVVIKQHQPRVWGHWIAHFILVSLLLILAATWRRPCSGNGKFPSLKNGLPREAFKMQSTRFNGSIDFWSKWKGTPRPELEAAWNSVTNDVTSFLISEDDLQHNGRGGFEETTVKFPPNIGDGYMAGLEVFHHLHCLNMLRKVSYREYYQDHDILWTDPADVFRKHVDHCIDMLRQRLMCSSDAGLITHVWVKGYGAPYPDYSTLHQCRDFEGIRNWAVRRQLPTNIRALSKPFEVAELESPPFP